MAERRSSRIRVLPVTADNWDDFTRLFEAKGGPHYCFCTPYRFARAPDMDKAQKKAAMRKLVAERTPIGVIAYDGSEPIGWCSIAPRETYVRLERSKTMPRETPLETPTWTVLCFFVVRSRRGTGVTRALLDGALSYARKLGAKEVEGYPFDAAGVSSTHRGHSSVFKKAGFQGRGRRWSRA